MENKYWRERERERERDGTHTFRKVDMCKWQMGDPRYTNEVVAIGLHMFGKD
jgi:hypothetical protein